MLYISIIHEKCIGDVSGTTCVMLAGSPLGLIDISLTKVKCNSIIFINIRRGCGIKPTIW